MKRNVLIVVNALNIIGILFGFAWYRGQIDHTLLYLIPFVPDSPLSAVFFVAVLSHFLWAKKPHLQTRWVKVVSALALTWLAKYGLWGVYILAYDWIHTGSLPAEAWVLIAVHLFMAIEAVVFHKVRKIFFYGSKDFLVATVVLLCHDYVDYVYNVYPYLPNFDMLPMMTVITPLLSILVIWYFSD